MITQGHIIVLLAFLVLAGMIVSPVSATSYTLVYPHGIDLLGDGSSKDITFDNVYSVSYSGFDDPEETRAIRSLWFDVPIGSTLDFTLIYGNNKTLTGSASVMPDGLLYANNTITLDAETASLSYIPAGEMMSGGKAKFFIGYGRSADLASNESLTGGILLASAQYGNTPVISNNLAILYETSDPSNDIITGISATCDQPFNIAMTTGFLSGTAISPGETPFELMNEWVSFAMQIGGAVLAFVLSIFGLIKFFFIDNLLVIIALWIAVTMAYSAISSRDIFGFYKKFFRLQRSLLDFIVGLWNILIQIIASFRGIFRI